MKNQLHLCEWPFQPTSPQVRLITTGNYLALVCNHQAPLCASIWRCWYCSVRDFSLSLADWIQLMIKTLPLSLKSLGRKGIWSSCSSSEHKWVPYKKYTSHLMKPQAVVVMKVLLSIKTRRLWQCIPTHFQVYRFSTVMATKPILLQWG